MAYLTATAIRWVDDDFPGWVEVELVEADGPVITLADKAPVSEDGGRLTAEVACPVAVMWGVMCCVTNTTMTAPGSLRLSS
ncbi:MAG: hypothetical protein ACRDTT_25935 [Pseudonocardiaceae bacterium]